MAKISGHGGFLVKQVGATTGTRFENSSYDIDYESVNDDVTTSGSEGWMEGLPIVLKVNSVMIEVPDDDAATFALALGILPGAVFSMWFKRGASAAFDQVQNTICKTVRISNPQTGARRVSIMCEYGKFFRGVSTPTLV